MEQRSLFDEPPRKPRRNLRLGRDLAKLGAERAADHADRETGGVWQEKAWAFFVDFANRQGGREFQIEDVRVAADGVVPEPPDNRAWGTVALRAARKGWIRKVGYRPVRLPHCHAAPMTVWVWAGGE